MLDIIYLAIFVIILVIIFVYLTDSSLNLFLAEKFGLSEELYYSGKTVWIVGCSSGIGESIALRLAHHGCQLILSARRDHLLQKLKDKCEDINPHTKCLVLPMDITDFSTIKEKVEEAKNFIGHVDVILLNSGQSQRSEWATPEPSVDEACFRVNALGPTVVAREYMRSLEISKDLQGNYQSTQFVVVSSLAGIIPAVLSPSYTAAKHALMGYFRLLSMEYSHKRISVSMVCPGLTYAPNNPLTAFSHDIDKAHGEILTGITVAHMSSERCAQLILIGKLSKLKNVTETKAIDKMDPLRAHHQLFNQNFYEFSITSDFKFLGTAFRKKFTIVFRFTFS